jgi:hypothetical protein
MDHLTTFVQQSTQRTAPQSVVAMADFVRAKHTGVVAILAYGSALRDSTPKDTLIDFYVIVEHAKHLSSSIILQHLGELIPPNVCYAETEIEGDRLRSKYAMITLAAFQKLMTARNPYLWVRFAQPTRLIWSRDENATRSVLESLTTAMRTAYGHALYLSAEEPWVALFQNTYLTELRPESVDRAAAIVTADQSYYATISKLLSNTLTVLGWQNASSAKCGLLRAWAKMHLRSRGAQIMPLGK